MIVPGTFHTVPVDSALSAVFSLMMGPRRKVREAREEMENAGGELMKLKEKAMELAREKEEAEAQNSMLQKDLGLKAETISGLENDLAAERAALASEKSERAAEQAAAAAVQKELEDEIARLKARMGELEAQVARC